MKYLIFSDTHLTDNFNESKYKFLKRIIESADRVIINGDFWDGYLTTFDKFINSPWRQLFPELLSKNTIYIYGNHDSPDLLDKRVELFSREQGYKKTLKSRNLILNIEHGQDIFKLPDKKFPKLLQKLGTIIHNFFRYIYFRINKKSYLNNFKGLNRHFKMAGNGQNKEFLVVGHSHGAELAESEYLANSGFIDWGYGSFLTIENGKIELKTVEY